MSYDNNFSYELAASFPLDLGTGASSIPQPNYNEGLEAFSKTNEPFQFKPNDLTSSLGDNGFDAKALTEELKVSAETASFATGALGNNPNMFSALTTSNKITPTAYYLDNKDVYYNTYGGIGVSKFENVRNLATDEDRLASSQTTGQRVGYGLTKAAQNFAKVFVQNTAGAVYGLGAAVADQQWSKLYDNDFTDALDDWNTVSRYKLANYRSDEEKQMSFFQKMGTANFWADDFAQGLSFTLGTIASELAWGAMTGGGGIFARGFARTANALEKGNSVNRAIGSVFRAGAMGGREAAAAERGVVAATRTLETAAQQGENLLQAGNKVKNLLSTKTLSNIKDGSNVIRSIYTSAAMEAGMEAKQTYRDSYDSFIMSHLNRNGEVPDYDTIKKFDDEARTAANLVFAANIPVVALSNFAQFGAIFGVNFGLTNRIGKAVGYNRFVGLEAKAALKDIGRVAGGDAFKVSRLGRLTGLVAPKVGVALTEGVWEEGTQGILSGAAKNWVSSRYNADKTMDNISVTEALYEAMKHQYGSNEGRHEMYLGMLIGAFGGNVSQAIQTRSAMPLVTGFFRSETGAQRNQNIKAWDELSTEFNKEGREAVEENFSKTFNRALNNILLKNQQDANTENAEKALEEGEITEANIYKMNAEFAKHYGTFFRMKDSVDFSFKDLMMLQVDQMDANEIAKEHGVSLEEAEAAKEQYKSEVAKQVDSVNKHLTHAKSILNLAGKKKGDLEVLAPFLANQLYVAEGLDTSLNNISAEIGRLWNKNDSFFASRFRLLDELNVSHEIDLDAYTEAKSELDVAKEELDRLNNELPSLNDKPSLDEKGNVKIASERQKQIEQIQIQSAKVSKLEKDLDSKLKRLNDLRFLNLKTRFGGVLDTTTNYNTLTHNDVAESLEALEALDIYKQELLNNKNTKQQGIYLHNLLQEYGKGVIAMQNISLMYDELADKNNKNDAAFILRLKGGDTINDFQETQEEKERLDAAVDSIQEKFFRDRPINDKTEARSIIRAFLRAGVKLDERRMGRDKDLVRVYDYATGKFINQSSVLANIDEPVQKKQWSIYVKEGLRQENPTTVTFNNKETGESKTVDAVDKVVRPELQEIANNIIGKTANKIPLSPREQIIFNENRGFIEYEVKKFKKQNSEFYESVIEKLKQKKEASKMSNKKDYLDNEYLKSEGRKESPEKDFLQEKIQRKLNNLSDFKQRGIDLPSAVSYVEDFSEQDVARYIELKNSGVLNEQQQKELLELEDKLRIISEFQGTTTEEGSNLLDDVRQLAQILRFEKESVQNQVNVVEDKDVADTENEFKKEFKSADGTDLSISLNYSMAFVTKKVYDSGQNDVFEIANITPSTFASLINAKVYDSQGNQVEIVSLENRNFINDSYKLVLENGTEVNFTINDKGNIVVSETTGDFQKLKDDSNYVLESISAFTKGQPLLLKNGEEFLYVESDFTNNDEILDENGQPKVVFNVMNQEAIKNVKQGDELIVVYPENSTWNKSLKKGVETFENGLLLLYTKDGEFVGVMKSTRKKEAASNKNVYYELRKTAIENSKKSTTFVNETLGHKDSGIRLPVELVWHGHPNFKMTTAEDGNIKIENFDFDENSVKQVTNIGYVQNGKIVDKNEDEELSLDGQYYMTAIIKKNDGKKVPFVVLNLNGRKVMYPINLKVIETNPSQMIDGIISNPGLSKGEKVEELNNLLNKFGVLHTSFFFNNASLSDEEFINNVKQRLVDSDLYGDLANWNDDRSIEEILTNEATINVDLNNTPFHSTKFKFSISEVKNENTSEEEAEKSSEKEAKTKRPRIKNGTRVRKVASKKGFEDLIKELQDKMAALPGGGITTKGGKIIETPEHTSLKAQLDDVIEKYDQYLKNLEGRKRGSSAVKKKAEGESKKNCRKKK